MQLHQIKPVHKLKKGRRIARGGKRGGYSGRGIKGQKSRAGAKIRPAFRDVILKFPKQRGRAKHAFKSLFVKPAVVNLNAIERKYKTGEMVNPATLLEKGLIAKKSGRLPAVKILSSGELSKKLHFSGVLLSSQARAKIKKAKGSVQKSE